MSDEIKQTLFGFPIEAKPFLDNVGIEGSNETGKILTINPVIKRKAKLVPVANEQDLYELINIESGKRLCFIKPMGEDWNPESEETP